MAVWRDSMRALLAERGMTRQELARLSGLSRSTVLHVLKGGHCSTETLERIAKALDVDVAELFTRAARPRRPARPDGRRRPARALRRPCRRP